MIKSNERIAFERKDGIQADLGQLDYTRVSCATQTNIAVKENSIQKTEDCINVLDLLRENLTRDAGHIGELGLEFMELDNAIKSNF